MVNLLRIHKFQIWLFSYSEHFSPTSRTYSLGCRFSIFHCYLFFIIHSPFLFTLNTISFHEK